MESAQGPRSGWRLVGDLLLRVAGFPALMWHNDGMSDKITVSHNRADYSPRVQMMISAMAKVFWNGDLDAAWEDYFESSERMAPDFAEARRKALRDSEAPSTVGEGLIRLTM